MQMICPTSYSVEEYFFVSTVLLDVFNKLEPHFRCQIWFMIFGSEDHMYPDANI